MSQLIQQGGPMVLLVLVLTLPALAIALMHAVVPRRWSRWVGGGMLALVFAVGVTGTLMGRATTDSATEGITDGRRDELRTVGYAEAMRSIQLAAVIGGLVLVAFAIGEVRGRRRRLA